MTGRPRYVSPGRVFIRTRYESPKSSKEPERDISSKRKKLIKSLNSNSFQIKLMGQLSLDNVPDVLLDMNFLLLPSRSEASPIVVLEALALGKIVIASNVGDLHYWANVFDGLIITDFKENFLFHTYFNINSSNVKPVVA